jgi:hypothetical protein
MEADISGLRARRCGGSVTWKRASKQTRGNQRRASALTEANQKVAPAQSDELRIDELRIDELTINGLRRLPLLSQSDFPRRITCRRTKLTFEFRPVKAWWSGHTLVPTRAVLRRRPLPLATQQFGFRLRLLRFHLLAQTGVSLSQQFKDSRIPGPRLRIGGNAIDILGGHEDAIGYNSEQHVLPNAIMPITLTNWLP